MSTLLKPILYYHDIFLEHRPIGYHPERPERLTMALEYIEKVNLKTKIEIREPSKASEEIVRKVHDPNYITLIKRMCESGGGYLDGDTYVCSKTYDVALYAVGALINAVHEAISNRRVCYCLVRPPGHHAGKSGTALGAPSLGFCIFNNAAIAAVHAINEGLAESVVILDIDCHHGNGTQEIFYDSDKVLYISIHQDPTTIYPGTGFSDEVGEGRGEGYNVNIPLPPRSGDDAYLMAMNIAINVIKQFDPKLIIVSAGYDTHHEDPITMMNITANTYIRIANMLKELNKPIIYTLEGGYGKGIAIGVSNMLAIHADLEPPYKEDEIKTSSLAMDRVQKALNEVNIQASLSLC